MSGHGPTSSSAAGVMHATIDRPDHEHELYLRLFITNGGGW
jgi:hypothetical protein